MQGGTTSATLGVVSAVRCLRPGTARLSDSERAAESRRLGAGRGSDAPTQPWTSRGCAWELRHKLINSLEQNMQRRGSARATAVTALQAVRLCGVPYQHATGATHATGRQGATAQRGRGQLRAYICSCMYPLRYPLLADLEKQFR